MKTIFGNGSECVAWVEEAHKLFNLGVDKDAFMNKGVIFISYIPQDHWVQIPDKYQFLYKNIVQLFTDWFMRTLYIAEAIEPYWGDVPKSQTGMFFVESLLIKHVIAWEIDNNIKLADCYAACFAPDLYCLPESLRLKLAVYYPEFFDED